MRLREKIEYREVLLVAMVLFVALGFMVGSTEYLESFDQKILHYIHREESTVFTAIAKAIGIIGSALGYMVIGIWLLFRAPDKNKYSEFKLYAVSALANTAFNQVSKLFYSRLRPSEFTSLKVSGYSFPSGHSMAAMGIGLTIAYILSRADRRRAVFYYALAAVVALIMGLSRLYLGVHWPTDIVGGYLGGITVFILAINMEFKKNKDPH